MTTTTPFLSILPPELRLRIYTQLLVAPKPLKGPGARQAQEEKYDIHTAIMRTSKQVFSEARHVFFGRNTFSISSILPQDDSDDASGAFEPPLQLKDLSLIRHLEVDLLYYPRMLRRESKRGGCGWQPVSHGAERYIICLSFLLDGVKDTLRTLRIGADVRPYTNSTKDEDNVFDVTKFLTGFQYADQTPRFKHAIATLPVKQLQLRFDFSETYFDFKVEKEVLNRWSLMYLAGQLAIKKSEIELRGLLEELDEEEMECTAVEPVETGTALLDCVC